MKTLSDEHPSSPTPPPPLVSAASWWRGPGQEAALCEGEKPYMPAGIIVVFYVGRNRRLVPPDAERFAVCLRGRVGN